MACPSKGKAIDHELNPSCDFNFTKFSIFPLLQVWTSLSHCASGKRHSRTSLMDFFNMSLVAEWRSPSKCKSAPELDLMGRGTCLGASVHSLWEQVPFCHLMRFHVTATLFFNVMVSAIKNTDVNKTLYEKYAHGYCYFSLPIEFQYYFYI